MAQKRALTIVDMPWLRQASQKAGASAVPVDIANKLLASGLVELDAAHACLKITKRGQLALNMLG